MIQAEHKEWVDRMFPGQPPRLPACLMLEEAGELIQALSKVQQEGMYGKELRYTSTDWTAKLKDAVGDCAISACSLCNANGWDFAELLYVEVSQSVADPVYTAVDIVQAAVCQVIDPQDKPNLAVFLGWLRCLCASLELNFEECIVLAWNQVKQRTR